MNRVDHCIASQQPPTNFSNLTAILFRAAERDDFSTLNLLQIRGADFQALNSNGETVLHVAVRECNLRTVEFILENELLDLNTVSRGGEPPIFLTNSVTMLRRLVYYGASIEETNSHGIPLLHYAASKDRYRIARVLIKVFKQDVNMRDLEEKTPLHFAAILEHADTADVLLQLGADVDAQTDRMHTPLHYAVIGKHKTNEVAKLLLGPFGNARYNLKDSSGNTALDLAAVNSIENQLNGVKNSLLSATRLNPARVHRSRNKLRASISFPVKNRNNLRRSPLADRSINLSRRP